MPTLLAVLLALVPLQTPPPFPQIGKPAPDFAFAEVWLPDGTRASGGDFTPGKLRGKVVVLDFFATWCAPCVAAMPHTNAVIEEAADLPLAYLAVVNEDKTVIEWFMAGRAFKAAVAFDKDNVTYGKYFVKSLPFVVIIDTEGHVSAFSHPEQVTRAMLEAAVK